MSRSDVDFELHVVPGAHARQTHLPEKEDRIFKFKNEQIKFYCILNIPTVTAR